MTIAPPTSAIDIRSFDLETVGAILAAGLPNDAKVWVFGSRVTGRARRGSDLDLAVDAGRRLTSAEAAFLDDAFDESDLPWTVDVVDLHAVGETFRTLVERERVPLPGRSMVDAREATTA